jgi:DNA-binding response OmpR family regulator
VNTPPGSRGTILVVDDDEQVRALVARALAFEGFDVLQAPDALNAIELLQDALAPRVCLIITDINMPGMPGDELGRLLHASRPTVPVLYMSGYSRPHFDFVTPEELSHCWIEKPFHLTELVYKALALCDPVQSPP